MIVLLDIPKLNESPVGLNVTNMDTNMAIASLFLEYLKVLIWPILIVYFFKKYHKYIDKMFKRVAEDSSEISSSFFGITVKFLKEMSEFSKGISLSESTMLNKKVSKFAKDQFSLLSNNFFSQPIGIRKKTAEQISELAKDMELNDILDFWQSHLPGERAGAAIGIGTHLKFYKETEKNSKVLNSLKEGLSDTYSRVRFRIVEAIGKSEYLINYFRAELSRIAAHDENRYVKGKAEEILRKYKT